MSHMTEAKVPRITISIQRRLMKLLFMEYKPSELAEEIGVTTKTIYASYIPAGLPFRKDEGGNIWIVGTVFREWANAVVQKGNRYKAQRRQPIGENQAYCMRCKTVRDFERITKRVKFSVGRIMVYGVCSVCGKKMNAMKKGAP